MGINLRSESKSVSCVSKETQYRLWWALFMIDTTLCVMTGRPSSTANTFCTTPFPTPYKEDDLEHEDVAQLITDNSPRNYLLNFLLSHEITTSVSSNSSADLVFSTIPGSSKGSSNQQAQATTETLSRLPAEVDFARFDKDDQKLARQCTSLAFLFYTTKLVISQPCLRRLANPLPGTKSPKVSQLCGAMASLCIKVAHKTLDLLPSEPGAALLYGLSPWWCMLHYIMQPTTVLLT
ncbi:hypothetical protein N7495_004726 [Penicillium taxi]|uniref:uncharacterized protein n=1 Tax=Penicillium taxi TaxID=168475 RepID=UPI0025457C50|nr:uncharacterized protein N7495_004726 [Penicillium taxi]KAJ5899982.1 hypothetical protein N7495_004726 [Penicillium taxi]